MFTRMKQGWELTKKAWSVVRRHPGLAKLPLIGGALALVAALVLAGPGVFLANADSDATRLVGYILIALGSYAASFIVIYYNVILAAAANDALDGREPDVGAARQIAKNRIPTIAGSCPHSCPSRSRSCATAVASPAGSQHPSVRRSGAS